MSINKKGLGRELIAKRRAKLEHVDGDNPLSGNDKDYSNLASMRNISPMLAHPKVVLAPLSPNPPQCRTACDEWGESLAKNSPHGR